MQLSILALIAFAASTAALQVATTTAPTRTTIGSLTVTENTESCGNAFGVDTTGCKIWDAGRVLSTLVSDPDAVSGKTVLELGSGTGVGGLSAAAAGAASVLLTDGADATLELLERNAVANGHCRADVDVARLRWGDESDLESAAKRGPFDLIMGSDLLYAPEAFPELLESLAALCTPDVTEVLLTYPVRFTESIFLEQAEEYNFEQIEWAEEVEPSLWCSRLRLRAE